MSSHNEITKLLFEELEKYDLKGELSERGKHLEVAWQGPQGRRFVICAKTPSDWRGGMNTRSDMRKMLREDNTPLKQEAPTSFTKAMSLPKQSLFTPAERERFLQKDVELISELVFELQGQNAVLLSQVTAMLEKMNSISVISTVMSNVSFSGQPVQQAIEQPVVQRVVPSRREDKKARTCESVLNCLDYSWTPASVVLRKCDLSRAAIYRYLHFLEDQGTVESGMHGMWRKKPNDNVVVLGSGNQSSS